MYRNICFPFTCDDFLLSSCFSCAFIVEGTFKLDEMNLKPPGSSC